MINTNYIGIIVKILDIPKHRRLQNKFYITEFRGQFRSKNQDRILKLVCWDKLASELKEFYKINDYVLVEGYLFQPDLRNKDLFNQNQKLVKVTVTRIYPYLSKPNYQQNKT
uniref:Hypothetical chloroplast RF41 n=1 Tax=Haslea nusantara TaxID=2600302 RepID=A0A5B8H9E5_9STRA|nr:hypothetical chloroplast RF41 [Haslea nusantara]QDX17562.1 hypothetical chloroplast RF41 [Haslea nusantara]